MFNVCLCMFNVCLIQDKSVQKVCNKINNLRNENYCYT